MCSESFRRFLGARFRDFQLAIEAEHARELGLLSSQLAHVRTQAARLGKGSTSDSLSSPCSPRNDDRDDAVFSIPPPDTPQVFSQDIPLPEAEAEVLMKLKSFRDDDGICCADETSTINTINLVDLSSRTQPKRSGTAPVIEVMPPSVLKRPRRSCSMSSMNSIKSLTFVPGAIDEDIGYHPSEHDTENSTPPHSRPHSPRRPSRSASRRPSDCSRTSGWLLDHRSSTFTSNTNRASTISGSSTDSSVAFEALKAWNSSWRKSRRMVRLDAGAEAEDDRCPTLLEVMHTTSTFEGKDDFHLSRSYADLSQYSQVRWRWLQPLMIQPSSFVHLVWGGVALMLISHDVVVIPLALFDLPKTLITIFIAWFIRFFWIADIVLSFLTTGLDSQGRIEVCPVKVAERYARTWLPLDLLCVLADWGSLALSESTNQIGYLRGLQLLRCLKLLRLAKAQVINDSICERMRSEQFILIATIARSIVMMLVVAHIIACLWYGIGRHAHELSCGRRGWVLAHRLESDDFHVRYFWAFHWSLALFAGEHIIQPQNMCERGFTIAAFFLFFVLSCLFVSSITTSLTRLQIISSEQSSQLSALRRYLSVHGISMSLSVRVQRNAQHAQMEQKRRTREDKIELLQIVSEPLRAEMHFEVHGPVLMEHAFFDCYHTVNPSGVQRLCHSAATETGYCRGDVVFHDLESPDQPRMFFLLQGRLSYCKQNLGEKPQTTQLCPGKWVSEANLWTKWIHRGTLKALTECSLLTLDAVKFQGIVSPYPTNHAHIYALQFVELLNVLDSTMLTDLFVPDQQDLLAIVFPEMQDDDESWTTSRAMRLKDRFNLRSPKTDTDSSMRLKDRFRKNKTRPLDSCIM